MEGYKTFHEALDQAVKSARAWKDLESGATLDFLDLFQAADFLDEKAPLEDYYWYVVFPDGEIDLMNTADKTIVRMFTAVLPASQEGGNKR